MNALAHIRISDRMLGLTFAALAFTVLALAAEAHLLCDLFCIHGEAMTGSEICFGRT